MNRVYVVEFLATKKNKIVSWFTGFKYTHTGIIYEIGNKLFFCDLRLRLKGQPDYQVQEMNCWYKMHSWFRNQGYEVDIFLLPHILGTKQANDGLNWWRERQEKNIKYDVQKLISMSNTKWIIKFAKWYYRKTGKPYKLNWDSVGDVCSIAADENLCFIGIDSYPKLTNRITPPGMLGERWKEGKVKE